MSVSKWRQVVAATVAVIVVASAGSTAAGEDRSDPVGASPMDVAGDPFDGFDLSDPLAAREEVQRRLGESAAASDVLAELVEVARTELVAAEQRSTATNEWLDTALRDAAAAREAAQRSAEEAAAAQIEAVEAREAARDALVDAYMSPSVGDAARVLVAVSDVNESSFLHGLLTSRAQSLTELVAAADVAEAAAATAAEKASLASTSADAAAAEATAAAEAAASAAEETGERLADLQLFTALVEAEVQSLAVVDEFLERVVAQREAAAAAAAGPPVPFSEVSAVGGTTIRVHRSVVDAVAAMVMAAAGDGVVLDGFGWRTVESQIALRQAHCGSSHAQVYLAPASSCSPPTAPPGSSMHERGLAIDFSNCGTRSTVCYQWLAQHAHRFGFFNLPSEPWHWSVNGH
jgi:hypothetical protein